MILKVQSVPTMEENCSEGLFLSSYPSLMTGSLHFYNADHEVCTAKKVIQYAHEQRDRQAHDKPTDYERLIMGGHYSQTCTSRYLVGQ